MTIVAGIPPHVIEAWAALPDRVCPCRRSCGRTVKIVCEDGWNDIADWLPDEVAKAPLDVDLLVQVLVYWSPVSEPPATQDDFNRECDRLEAELESALARIATSADAAYIDRRGGDW